MDDLVQLILKTYGVAGLIILSPMAALVVLWREYLKKTNKDQTEINRLNEQRVLDAKAISDKLMLLVSEQSSLNKETNMALERVGDVLSNATSIQTPGRK